MKSSAFTNSQFSSLPRKFGAIRQDTDPLLWEEELKEKVNFSMDSVMSHLSKQLRPPLCVLMYFDLTTQLMLDLG